MGATVLFEAEPLTVSSDQGKPRRVEFRVRATMIDKCMGEKVIGEGTHQRAIIDVSRFRQKVAE